MTHKKSYRQHFIARYAYNGTCFNGVQEQPGQKTVLGALRARIEDAAQQKAHVLVASARTDKGVFALSNWASFYLNQSVDIDAFIQQASHAREDGLLSVMFERADSKTHARGNASLKTYRYTIKDDIAVPAETGGMVWIIAPKLTVAAMQFAALDFLGERDFSSVRGGGCEAGSPIKNVYAINICRTTSGYIIIEIEGYGFLRKMVRNIVGLLVEVGAGLRPCDAIEHILKEKNRQAAGIMAPAHGLLLVEVQLKHSGTSKRKVR